MPHHSASSRRLLVGVLLVLAALVQAAGRDFYKILGVPHDANEAAIKKAYRKAALKWCVGMCGVRV